ncbi:HepT-like ribonuclease domain-containing protein [Methanomethylovorans sp.]|uniref:HepT-like ribonuclease domain-containing protein n=1 Tax=Methanomethylovorans sp. TaxID=2758717 RepID=UPI003D103BC9
MKGTDVFLKHIIDSIEKIEDFTDNKTREDFLEDIQLQDATIRRIEIVPDNTCYVLLSKLMILYKLTGT